MVITIVQLDDSHLDDVTDEAKVDDVLVVVIE